MLAQNRRLYTILFSMGILLLIPLIAMQFTNEVNWELMDFVVVSVLLFTVSLTIEFISRKVAKRKYQVILAVVVVLLFVLIWAELAVGIFGTPLAGD